MNKKRVCFSYFSRSPYCQSLLRNTNHEELSIKELALIRESGYAVEEHEYRIRCIAAPIFDYDNRGCAAPGISTPTVRRCYKFCRTLGGWRREQLSTELKIAKYIFY